MDLSGGCEWIVEAYNCDPEALRDLPRLQKLFEEMTSELGLHPLAEPAFHQFPGEGGITGLALLSESHLACHTFPEFGSLCLNLFCCRPRPEWNFADKLKAVFGATSVQVRRVDRPYSA